MMEIKAYVCPQCGASLDVGQNTRFTYCPNCGNKLHISYEGDSAPSGMRTFTTPNGIPVGCASLPSDYQLEGAVNEVWQSEMTPMMGSFCLPLPKNFSMISRVPYTKACWE